MINVRCELIVVSAEGMPQSSSLVRVMLRISLKNRAPHCVRIDVCAVRRAEIKWRCTDASTVQASTVRVRAAKLNKCNLGAVAAGTGKCSRHRLRRRSVVIDVREAHLHAEELLASQIYRALPLQYRDTQHFVLDACRA